MKILRRDFCLSHLLEVFGLQPPPEVIQELNLQTNVYSKVGKA